MSATDAHITDHEQAQIDRANASTSTPVVFVHGLWLLPSSWERWAALFEEAGYVAVLPGWPDDPETVEEAKAHPDVFAGKGIGEIADHLESIIRRLDRKPAAIGQSLGCPRERWAPVVRCAACCRSFFRSVGSLPHRSQSARPRSRACCRCRSPRS